MTTMRKLIILFSMLVLQFSVAAQNDSLMPNLSATYLVDCYVQEGWPGMSEFHFINQNVEYDTVEVYSSNETLIANLYYDSLQVWIKRTSEPPSCYAGWRDEMTNEWELLYDFGLSVGDSAYSIYGDLNSGYITSIEEVVIQGETRKKFIIDDGLDSYIQGIGSVSHPFVSKMYIFEVGYTLCESSLYYTGPSPIDTIIFSPDCNGEILSVQNNKELPDFKLYPNPSNSFVNLDFDGLVSGQVKIINLAGQTLQTHLMTDKTLRLDTSELAKGVYFVSLETEDGTAIKKMVVN